MQIAFTTKEESKAAQQEAFLALSGGERVWHFIKLSNYILSTFPSNAPDKHKGNFIIDESFKKKK